MVDSYLFNLMPLKMAYYSTIIDIFFKKAAQGMDVFNHECHKSLTLVKTTLWELKTCSADLLRSLIRTVEFGQLAMQLTQKSHFLHIEPQTHPYNGVLKNVNLVSYSGLFSFTSKLTWSGRGSGPPLPPPLKA